MYNITDIDSYEDAIKSFFAWPGYLAQETVFLLIGNESHLSHLRKVSKEKVKDIAKKHSAMFIEMSFMEDMSGFDTAFLDFVKG